MITTVEKLIEKLLEFNSDMQVRILDLMDDSGESGIYKIKSVEINEVEKYDSDKTKEILTICIEVNNV